MTISSTSLSQLSSVTATTATSRVSQALTTDTASSTDQTTGSSSKTKLSKLGELMSKLQDLESNDPAKAKQVLTQIASNLTDKANSSSDPRLKELADKFSEAASTGDLSGLKPSGPPRGERRGPPPGPPPSDDATTTTATSASKTGRVAKYSESARAERVDLESIVSDALSGVSQ